MTAGRGGGRRHDRNGDLRSGSGGAVDRGRRHGFLCRPRPGWPRSRIQRMEKNSLAGHGCSGLGGGIWSMHFIAMLAFVLPVPVDYDFKLTAISLLVAILATGAGFYVVAGDPQRRRRLAFGGVLIGTGIVAMHYTGMSAMLMRCSLRYDLLLLI